MGLSHTGMHVARPQFVRTREGQLRGTKNAYVRERQLEIGDIVGRQLMTGDVVLFNRQPSLHKVTGDACRMCAGVAVWDGQGGRKGRRACQGRA